MGILLCEQNFRDVWRRNKSVRAEIGQILHTHTHAAKLLVEIMQISILFLETFNIHISIYLCTSFDTYILIFFINQFLLLSL